MTVTNNGLICQRYYKEEGYLKECVGVFHSYMYITDWSQSLRPRLLYAKAKYSNPKNVQEETLRLPLVLVTC